MIRGSRVAVLALGLIGCSRPVDPEVARRGAPPPRADGRLPRGAHPTRYALDLTVDPSQERFSGRARIDVKIDDPTSAVVMNARGLTVRSAALVTPNSRLPAKTELRRAAGSKEDPEELVLSFDRVLAPGDIQIEIDYDGPFAPGLRGLYRVEENKRWYAFTQFEPTDARRAFPCFDEPGWKTPFTVAISVPSNSIAVSNMPEVGRRPDGALTRFEFAPSPPMPTYLVALAVGAFDMREGLAGKVPIRLITTTGKARMGAAGLATLRGQLAELERYFGRPFPYPKLDLLAVPNFGAGAMENVGLITIREERILLDDHAALAARLGMAAIVAHEAAHQWFGDLVTMTWWDDVWLNEAFATFMNDEIVDAWRPETGARLQALAAKSQVMGEDALASARRIRQPVRSTSEAQEAFDPVTYFKGRAVLAMTEAWLGSDAFRAGLRRYLQRHEWRNATADDLYAALAEASGRDVAGVVRSFTDQTGFPVIDARVACDKGKAPVIKLRQREYRTLDRPAPDGGGTWRIPVCISVDAGKRGGAGKACTILAAREGTLELAPGAACPALIYPNAGETGYYRVAMGPAELKAFAPVIGRLPERERFGVVSNAWAAVRAGQLPVSAFLELCLNLKNDRSRLVWNEMLDALRTIDRALITDATRPAFARVIRALCGPAARRLGWRAPETEPDDDRYMREGILRTLGDLGEDGATLAEAARRARAWLDAPATESSDLARIALPLAAKPGDAALYDRLLAVVTHPPTPEARVMAVAALAHSENPALIERTLGLMMDGTIKLQDFRYLGPMLGLRSAARDVAYAWLERHFDEMARQFPSFVMSRVVHIVAPLCDARRVRAADEFMRPRAAKLEGVEKDLRQSVEEGLRCAALADAQRVEASRWLSARR